MSKKNKLFGERWQVGSQIGSGGQGRVHHATDTKNPASGKFALKTVDRPKKHERFRREIESVTKLDHPHVIRIIDHSNLDEIGKPGNIPYFVMPLAEGKDLTSPDRLKNYASNIEQAINDLIKMASGLSVAHSAGIIHRDIKPKNILYTKDGQPLIGDFGICLVSDEQRLTEDGEIVGPRHFIAPELDEGRLLEATAAADVYSLGKVALYMISNGLIAAREELGTPEIRAVLQRSGMHTRLGILLTEMICDIKSRIKSMDQIIERLKLIRDWDVKNEAGALTEATLSGITEMQMKAAEKMQATTAEEDRKEKANAARVAKQFDFGKWLEGEFKKVEDRFDKSGLIKPKADLASIPNNFNIEIGGVIYGSKGGMQLAIERGDGITHLVQMHLCDEREKDNLNMSVSDEDPRLVLVPFYWRKVNPAYSKAPALMGYLTPVAQVGQIEGKVEFGQLLSGNGPGLKLSRSSAISRSFKPAISLSEQFRWVDWPQNIDKIRKLLDASLQTSFDFINSGSDEIGN